MIALGWRAAVFVSFGVFNSEFGFTIPFVPNPVDSVIDYLKTANERGQTHVYLDDQARHGLRELYKRSRNAPAPAPSPAPVSPPLVTEPVAAPEPAVSAPLTAEGTNKAEQIAALKAKAETWEPARELGTLRETMVFSVGNPDAQVMLVGEAPGYEEEKQREPFVGPAGRKLNDILKAMGLAREEVYISNIVKFRPATARQTTNNRKPSPEEMASCIAFVQKEIEIVSPKCIIALGGTAAEGLLGLSGSVGSMREKWHDISGTPVRVTYHPSYLLQSGSNNEIKRKLWEDMLAVMEQLGLPISEKQRGFFLPK